MSNFLDCNFVILENMKIKLVNIDEQFKWIIKNKGTTVKIDDTIINNIQILTIFLSGSFDNDHFFTTTIFGGKLDLHHKKHFTLGEAKNFHWMMVEEARNNFTFYI